MTKQYVVQITYDDIPVTYLPVPRIEDAIDIVVHHRFTLWMGRHTHENPPDFIRLISATVTDENGEEAIDTTAHDFPIVLHDTYVALERAVEIAISWQLFGTGYVDMCDGLVPKRTTTQLRSDQRAERRERVRRKEAERVERKAKENEELRLSKIETQKYYDIKNLIPIPPFQAMLDEQYQKYIDAHPNPRDREEGWGKKIFRDLEAEHMNDFVCDAVLIQVATSSVYGAGAGVFVPADIIDQSIDNIMMYTGDKFTLDDLSALFNLYFRDLGLDPGFYIDPDRDGLRLKMLAQCYDPRRPFRITDQGRAFVEELLEYHSTVFRPFRYEDMYYPVYSGIVAKGARERRELRDYEHSHNDPNIARYPCVINVQDYMQHPDKWMDYL